jgi:hypothetical protein
MFAPRMRYGPARRRYGQFSIASLSCAPPSSASTSGLGRDGANTVVGWGRDCPLPRARDRWRWIRGVIPATVLVDLEQRLAPRRLATVFDLIVGTSTGGIIALGLTVPNRKHPRHPAERLLEFYLSDGEAIFPGGGPVLLTRTARQPPSYPSWVEPGSVGTAGSLRPRKRRRPSTSGTAGDPRVCAYGRADVRLKR